MMNPNKDLIQKYPQVPDLTPTTVSTPGLNILDWLASKSKLKEQNSVTTEKKMPKVHSVDGDVMQYWETSINDHREDFTDYNEVHDNIVSGTEWQSAVYEDDVWEESNNIEDNDDM